MSGDDTDISLYIHVPFCSKKCPYCHFFVLPDTENHQEIFVKALHQEWLLRTPLLSKKKIVSIYFGGGTPSLLPPSSIEQILSWIHKGPASLALSCEITLEVNPEKVTANQIKAFMQAGINRISIGIQSFDDILLKTLGRTHCSQEAKEAILCTKEAGIHNISIDLMYELPHQTISQWEHSIQEALSLPITHLSLYNLVFEPGTLFYKKKKTLSCHLPSAEDSLSMLKMAIKHFTLSGLKRYEISAFAKDEQHSHHNIGYWTGRPFLGIGPSAFSYMGGRRFQNTPHLLRWAKQIQEGVYPEHFEETLNAKAQQGELLAIALRLLQGVNLETFIKQQGPLFPDIAQSIQTLITQGFLLQTGPQLSLTDKGCNFYDTVASEIV